MKKLLLFFILGAFLAFGFSYFKNTAQDIIFPQDQVKGERTVQKLPILRIGLVADSENDNENLKRALVQLQGVGVNFVIGLGDWSNVGTIDELTAVRDIFEASKLKYYLTSGDHDLWDSRNRGEQALTNFNKVFGDSSRSFEQNGVDFVLVDNSDIYKGIGSQGWKDLSDALNKPAKLQLVFAHKTPFHPDSKHIMGEDTPEVAKQAENLLNLLQGKKVGGFFSGDLHFFAKFKSPDASVKITTIGAISAERNFQGPRFGVLTIFDDYSWEIEDIEIR